MSTDVTKSTADAQATVDVRSKRWPLLLLVGSIGLVLLAWIAFLVWCAYRLISLIWS